VLLFALQYKRLENDLGEEILEDSDFFFKLFCQLFIHRMPSQPVGMVEALFP
jgi:hypothetical protein